jgi:hypothetical protein
VLRLGFAGCRGGGTNDLLRGIEDVRWASRWWGSEAVGAPPRPQEAVGWWAGPEGRRPGAVRRRTGG